MHPEHSDTDAFLWSQFQKGDPESLGQLMTRHYPMLLRYGTRFTRNSCFVRDCLQDIFVELWNRRESLRVLDSGQVRPYLMTMLRRQLHQEYLQNQHFAFQDVSDQLDFTLPDPTDSAEAQLVEQEARHETTSRLRHLLHGLPARAREAIYLRYYDELERPAIARIMGISEQSVSNLLQEAFRILRRHARAEHFWAGILTYFLF